MEEPRLVLQRPGEVLVRMYGQGFGDCFLLALPRAGAEGQEALAAPVYVLIDCGVFYGTPGEKARLQAVAASVRDATGGAIDLLVATHEHYDHLSGFKRAAAIWKDVTVRHVWLAWTEDKDNPAAQAIDREREALALAVESAVAQVETLALAGPSWAQSLRVLGGLAAFGDFALPAVGTGAEDSGENREAADPDGQADAMRPPRSLSKLPDQIMDALTEGPCSLFAAGSSPDGADFCAPGDVRTVPDTVVDAYVLGPPTDPVLLGLTVDEDLIYHLAAAGAEAAGAQRLSPFRRALCIPYAAAQGMPFFTERYFDLPPAQRIDDGWARDAGALALQLDDLTNNTSLALAFRLPGGRVLLFPGDAQVGNWLSWRRILPDAWRRPDGGALGERPTVDALLAATVLYKVGHHGSHNATLRQQGLELMRNGVVALVPTARAFPQTNFEPPWQIPLPGLLARLKTKCRGRVVLPYDNEFAAPAFARRLERSAETLPPMVRKQADGTQVIIEEGVNLWRQVRLRPAR